MVILSESIEFAGLSIKNRFVMPPMVRNLATTEGMVTNEVVQHYEECSKGQVGLIIVEAAAITWEQRIMSKNIGIYDDKCIPGLKKLAEGINRHGAKSFIQINYSGLKGHGKERYVGPSEIPVLKNTTPEAITNDEIEDVKQWFVDAARRAKEEGHEELKIAMEAWGTGKTGADL